MNRTRAQIDLDGGLPGFDQPEAVEAKAKEMADAWDDLIRRAVESGQDTRIILRFVCEGEMIASHVADVVRTVDGWEIRRVS